MIVGDVILSSTHD